MVNYLIKSTDTFLDNYFGFCYATVSVPKDIRAPLLPFIKEDGSLIHPTGNWTRWFTSEILKAARDTKNVTVHLGYKLEKSDNLFSAFVTKFSNIKIAADLIGDKVKRTTAKLIHFMGDEG